MKQRQNKYNFLLSRSVVRGIVWLLPLLAFVSIIAYNARKVEPKDLAAKVDSLSHNKTFTRNTAPESNGDIQNVERFKFDPNTVSYIELRRLGVSKSCAASIIKYRERGKVFAIKEDFATCYGLSDADYIRLEPLIVIGEQFRVKPTIVAAENYPKTSPTTHKADSLFTFDPNTIGRDQFVRLGFTERQWSVFNNYRSTIGRIDNIEAFGKCYAVSDKMLEKLHPYIVIAPLAKPQLVELNKADSATLRSVKGIGEVTVRRIIEYRERLGGYHSVGQLCEIEGVSERNFEKISKQIWVDSCEIRKIDINFAPAKHLVEALSRHPYAGNVVARKLLKHRQLKGGWRTIGDIKKDDILSDRQAETLAPYLLFRTQED